MNASVCQRYASPAAYEVSGRELRLKREQRSGRRQVSLPGFLESEDQANKFLGGMGNSNVVVFTFCPFLGKIGSESMIPDADVLGGIEKGIAEVTGTALLHVWIGIVQLTGLVG